MNKRINLKDKMDEIDDRFAFKNKTALANDILENKLMYLPCHTATSKRR
jgi:hypothetical protein